MHLWVPIVLSSLALCFASVVQALYADEAYQTDYHLPFLGLPQAHTTFFHRPSAASKASLLYTLSDRLVLGAVNPKDGVVIWRQQLSDQAQNGSTSGLLKAAEGGNTLVSAVGGKVQTWDATDGRLVWEWQGSGSVKNIESLASTEDGSDVLTLSEEKRSKTAVRRLAAGTGNVLWEHVDTSGDVPYALVSFRNSIYYLSLYPALLKGFKIKVTKLDASTGVHGEPPMILSSDGELATEDSILHVGCNSGVPMIIWTDKALKTLKINTLGTNHISSVGVPFNSGDSAKDITVHAPRSAVASPHFLVHYKGANSHQAEVYHVSASTGAVRKAFDLPPVGGEGSFSASSQGSDLYFTRHTAFENILISSTSPTVLSKWGIRRESQGGIGGPHIISHATSEVLSRAGSTYAVRSALALPSGDWELIRNGETSWVRHEGLAGAITAAFLEIPREEDLARELAAEGMRDPLAAYLHRIRRHLRDLQYFPEWAEALPSRLLGSFFGDKTHIEDKDLRPDGFGFRKIVIIATERGRLAALDTGIQGKVIWNIQAVTLKAGEAWNVLSIEAEGSSALIRAKGGEFLRVSAKTGAIIQYQPEPVSKALETFVSVFDVLGNNVLIPINRNGSLGALPVADFAQGTVIVTEGEDGLVRGWKLSHGAKPGLVWQFTPVTGQRVNSVKVRLHHDPVASIGKALGDRNVLYKYLNPNLLVITAVGIETATATFYILDAVSGAVIYSVSHHGVDGSQPIVSTISENWFVYSFYSESIAVSQNTAQTDHQKLKGHQLVVSEFYESPHPNDRGSLGSSLNFSTIYPTAADQDDISVATPHVISQTYLIPGPISSLAVTSTLQGITTRSLLGVLPYLNSLISISRAFVDARRPVGRDPTPSEAEEGLFRYSPVLDFEPKWILSHKRDIISMSKVITSPSLLESTSLVFAFGKLDLFGTRISPIGAFDILGKGFSKLQLALTVVALAVGTTVVAPFVRKKQIDGTWKA